MARLTIVPLLLGLALAGCENPIHKLIIEGAASKSAEISVTQSTADIVNGGSYSYGAVVRDVADSRTFTITNLGNADLELRGNPRVEITQVGVDFNVAAQPRSPIGPAESADFVLTLTPTVLAEIYATVSIKCNDIDEAAFAFSVSGTGITRDIGVTQGETSIPDGTGEYDFGDVDAGNTLDVVFTLENSGEAELLLTGDPKVAVSGTGASSFTVTLQPSSPVSSQSNTQFTLRFQPMSGGEKNAVVEIDSNDPDENPYDFAIVGTGIIPDAPAVTGTTPTLDTAPVWTWSSGGGTGSYRYKLDDDDLSTGATQTTDTVYEPPEALPLGAHILYVQESNIYGAWTVSGSFSIEVTDVMALGWIGNGVDGWQTGSIHDVRNDLNSFRFPLGVYVEASGNIYVTDDENHRVSKWDSDGNAIGWIGGGSGGWQETAGALSGDDYQSFDSPGGVYVDTSGYIYVADTDNHRVSKWNGDGNAVGWIGDGVNGWQTGTSPAYGGTDLGDFYSPQGIHVDGSGYIYVADTGNDRICKWDTDGNAIGWIGGGSDTWQTGPAPAGGAGYRSFNGPADVCLDASGNIYVAEVFNCRISKWDADGNAVGWIGGGVDGWQTGTAPATGGTDHKSFGIAAGVFVDGTGNIYVTDSYNHRVAKWDTAGSSIGWIGGGENNWQTGETPFVTEDYQSFHNPEGICVSDVGFIFIAEYQNARVSKWQD